MGGMGACKRVLQSAAMYTNLTVVAPVIQYAVFRESLRMFRLLVCIRGDTCSRRMGLAFLIGPVLRLHIVEIFPPHVTCDRECADFFYAAMPFLVLVHSISLPASFRSPFVRTCILTVE